MYKGVKRLSSFSVFQRISIWNYQDTPSFTIVSTFSQSKTMSNSKSFRPESIPVVTNEEVLMYYSGKVGNLSQQYELRTGEKDESSERLRSHYISIVDTANFLTKIVRPELSGYKLRFDFNLEAEKAVPVLVRGDDILSLEKEIAKLPNEVKKGCANCEDPYLTMETFRQALQIDGLINLDTSSHGKRSEEVFLPSNSCLENPFFFKMSLGYPVEHMSLQMIPLKEGVRNMWNSLTRSAFERKAFDLGDGNLQWYLDSFREEELNIFDFIVQHNAEIKNKDWIPAVLSNLEASDIDFDSFIEKYLANDLYLSQSSEAIFGKFKECGFQISKDDFLKFAKVANIETIKPLISLLKQVNPLDAKEKPLLFEVLEDNLLTLAELLIDQGADPTVFYNGDSMLKYVGPTDELLGKQEKVLRDKLATMVFDGPSSVAEIEAKETKKPKGHSKKLT